MENKNKKQGFTGLSDLTTDIQLNPKANTGQTSQGPVKANINKRSNPDTSTSSPDRRSTKSPPTIETVSSDKTRSSSVGKWFLSIIGIVFVVWVFNNDQNNKKPSSIQTDSYPDNNSQAAISLQGLTPSAKLQYTKPSVGTDNLLSVAEIRWCIRNDIRIEAMRNVINTNAGVDSFNQIVNDFNSRCGSYRYRQGSQSRAERDVEQYRSQIVEEATHEARQLRGTNIPMFKFSLPETVANNASKKPEAQHTREAQQLLTDLGYEPGPIDGDYGRRTAAALKAFQRDVGIKQDGWINKDIISALRRAKVAKERTKVIPSKSQQINDAQRQSNTFSVASTDIPENLSFDEQSRYDTAKRLKTLGHNVDWRTNSLTDMLDTESKIGVAHRLTRLGHNMDWRTSTLTDMLDIESRISVANRLNRKGVLVDWRNYSLSQLINMEYEQK